MSTSSTLPLPLLALACGSVLPATSWAAQEPEGEHFLGRQEYYERKMPEGESGFRVTGFATASLTDPGEGGMVFGARFNPVFLWRIRPQLVAEVELGLRAGPPTEFSEEDGGLAEENVRLEVANLEWEACEWAAVIAGRIRSPFGIYSLQFEPAFLEPFLTRPLIAGEGGLEPETMVGAELRGGAEGPGNAAWHWDLFVGDAPELDDGTIHVDDAGLVRWEETGGDTRSTMIGGRLGFVLQPGVEIGASALQVRLESDAILPMQVDGQLLGLDFQAQQDLGRAGTGRVAGEVMTSDLKDATYLPGTADAFSFDNQRDGGWVFAGWRPGAGALDQAEALVRYDWLNGPESGTLDAGSERRWSLGLNWWLGTEEVLKFMISRTDLEDEESVTGFGLEFAVGL